MAHRLNQKGEGHGPGRRCGSFAWAIGKQVPCVQPALQAASVPAGCFCLDRLHVATRVLGCTAP